MLRWERLGRDLKNPILFLGPLTALSCQNLQKISLKLSFYTLCSWFEAVSDAYLTREQWMLIILLVISHYTPIELVDCEILIVSKSFLNPIIPPRWSPGWPCVAVGHPCISACLRGIMAPMPQWQQVVLEVSAFLLSWAAILYRIHETSHGIQWGKGYHDLSWHITDISFFFYHIDVFLILVCPTSEALALNKAPHRMSKSMTVTRLFSDTFLASPLLCHPPRFDGDDGALWGWCAAGVLVETAMDRNCTSDCWVWNEAPQKSPGLNVHLHHPNVHLS